MMLHTKYQGSRPCGFRKEDFSCFSYISLCKTCDPREGAIFGLNNFGRDALDGALGLMVSDKKIFQVFISKIFFSLCDL